MFSQGLRWMVGLRIYGLNGILADEMGLGKTLMVSSLQHGCCLGFALSSPPIQPDVQRFLQNILHKLQVAFWTPWQWSTGITAQFW